MFDLAVKNKHRIIFLKKFSELIRNIARRELTIWDRNIEGKYKNFFEYIVHSARVIITISLSFTLGNSNQCMSHYTVGKILN